MMNELVFNKNSWHYFLASRIASFNPYNRDTGVGNNTDICTYMQFVIGGVVLLMLYGVGFTALATVTIHFILGVWFSIMTGTFFFSGPGIVGLVIFGGVIFTYLIMWSITLGFKHRTSSPTYCDKPDGFVKHAYKSWKEKYCVNIKFE